MAVILSAKDLRKEFKVGNNIIKAIDSMSFKINEGELVIILGPSGAGKTTLLNMLGGMDTLSSGSLILENNDLSKYNQKELTKYRRNDVGFVFQFYNLMPNLTALENIELATELKPDSMEPIEALKLVGLEKRANNFPAQLSGGEQQRVSIARAIAKNPKIILCDEPTGALDYQTGKNILGILKDASKIQNKTVIIVTHNQALKDMADKVIRVKNGKVLDITINENPMDIKDIEW
ncbi:MAG: ABC transporter ATP-binding protein [Acholeplasmatales bacterium]|nr:ABC transporter ATP-binding protein [Acholeplasmatales bacterium]